MTRLAERWTVLSAGATEGDIRYPRHKISKGINGLGPLEGLVEALWTQAWTQAWTQGRSEPPANSSSGEVQDRASPAGPTFGATVMMTSRVESGIGRYLLRNDSPVPRGPPDWLEQLKGDRDEQFSVVLTKNWRLIFEIDHDPIPRREDDGIALDKVTAIRFIEV
jgi:hypothetical protein